MHLPCLLMLEASNFLLLLKIKRLTCYFQFRTNFLFVACKEADDLLVLLKVKRLTCHFRFDDAYIVLLAANKQMFAAVER